MRSTDVRLRQDDLDRALAMVHGEMRALTEEFAQSLRRPWPAHLVVQVRAPYVTVRWRLPGDCGRGQSMFVLLGSGHGRTLLQSLPVSTRRLFLEFDRRAMELNLRYELLRHEKLRLEQFAAYLRDWRDASRMPVTEEVAPEPAVQQ